MEEADIHHQEQQATTFTYILPFIQTFLANRGLTEYHIQIQTTVCFKQAFLDNTETTLMSAINNFIATNYQKEIFYQGQSMDPDYKCDYIYLHLKSETAESTVIRIINDLNKQYTTEWMKHRVPRLFSMVQQKLSNNPSYFAKSISHFQEENGFDVTQSLIEIYFDHICPTQDTNI
jgi:hypothetical protein